MVMLRRSQKSGGTDPLQDGDGDPSAPPAPPPSPDRPRTRVARGRRSARALPLLALVALVAFVVLQRPHPAATAAPPATTAPPDAAARPANDRFDADVWPVLRGTLCRGDPAAPHLELAARLFELARQEVFGSDAAGGNGTAAYVPTRPDLDRGASDRTRRLFFSGRLLTASVFGGVDDLSGTRFATVYARIWKCGNDQIRALEREAVAAWHASGDVRGAARDEVPLADALAAARELAVGAEDAAGAGAPEPCVYTAVRDPLSHFVSGYNELEARLREAEHRRVPRAPYHAAFPIDGAGAGPSEPRRRRFRAFVEDLLLEADALSSHWVYHHFYPMSRILSVLGKARTPLTGYLPTLDNLASTWPDFMARTCGPRGFPSRARLPPTMAVAGGHASSADALGLRAAAAAVVAEGGPVARALCLLHAFDYACFPVLPGGVPAACRSVYADRSDELLGRRATAVVGGAAKASVRGKAAKARKR